MAIREHKRIQANAPGIGLGCHEALILKGYRAEVRSNNGARSRNRTGTVLPPRDFKSLASTNFAIRAYKMGLHKNGGASRSRTGLRGFAIQCITALLSRLLTCATRLQTKTWSGKRDSNSRPQPWQGCALPTELFPLYSFQALLDGSRILHL